MTNTAKPVAGGQEYWKSRARAAVSSSATTKRTGRDRLCVCTQIECWALSRKTKFYHAKIVALN